MKARVLITILALALSAANAWAVDPKAAAQIELYKAGLKLIDRQLEVLTGGPENPQSFDLVDGHRLYLSLDTILEGVPRLNQAEHKYIQQLDPEEETRWFKTGQNKPRGVILVFHGLNLKPSRMNGLVDLFQGAGYDVLRVSLSGHRGSLQEFQHVSRLIWLREAWSAYFIAEQRATELGLQVSLVGYSLGALVAEDLLSFDSRLPIHFDKALLLAPAIALRSMTKLIQWVGLLLPNGFIFPSLNLEDYRANRGTPVAGYRALEECQEHLISHGLRSADIPTLTLIDPEDELVSADGVGDLMNRFHLKKWQLVKVSNGATRLSRSLHHLILNAVAVGPVQWSEMSALIAKHFSFFP